VVVEAAVRGCGGGGVGRGCGGGGEEVEGAVDAVKVLE